MNTTSIAVPMQHIGPIHLWMEQTLHQVLVPLATFESPMWPSTNRGASVSRATDGIYCTLIDDQMTRSVLIQAKSAQDAHHISSWLQQQHAAIQAVFTASSRFLTLKHLHTEIIGNLLYIRLSAQCGDASGHNMITKGADAFIQWLLQQQPALEYVSISGNFCTDKKVSAVNSILGRGKKVIAEMTIPAAVCRERLKTTPSAIINLHIKKNLIGSIVSAGIRSANAHVANLLLAFYLATGQDAANIVEGSQAIVHCELTPHGDLYFSVTLPNIIVGTVGNGKHHDAIQKNIAQMGCADTHCAPGDNARRLAQIAAATVLCGELSLLAAQTNPGELMQAHHRFERGDGAYQSPKAATSLE